MEKLGNEKTINNKWDGFEQIENTSVSILGYLGEVLKVSYLRTYDIG
jgi:hypothetical protein